MNKHHKLIVGSGPRGFSLANETDADIMSDYSPGAWAISRKLAVKWAKEYLAKGDTVTVSTYDDPKYAKAGNEIIKELGISQALFQEPEAVKESVVTNGKPSNLSQLKKYLQPGVKVRMVRPNAKSSDGVPIPPRETEVVRVQTNAITTQKGSGESWLYYEKAELWSFDNAGATLHYIGRYDAEKGKMIPTVRIEYV